MEPGADAPKLVPAVSIATPRHLQSDFEACQVIDTERSFDLRLVPENSLSH